MTCRFKSCRPHCYQCTTSVYAVVAELAYAHDSGSCPCTWVGVQVPSTALLGRGERIAFRKKSSPLFLCPLYLSGKNCLFCPEFCVHICIQTILSKIKLIFVKHTRWRSAATAGSARRKKAFGIGIFANHSYKSELPRHLPLQKNRAFGKTRHCFYPLA